MAYYKDLQEVNNTGGEAYIHRLQSSIKGVWYVRIKRNNAPGYFRKSLRTTDAFEASKRANRYWLQVREAEEQQIVLAPRNNFASLARKWLNYRLQTSSGTSTRIISYQFHNYFIPYFGQWNVGNITERAYIKFLNTHRLIKEKCPAMRKRPTLRTLDVEQQNLSAFLNWCFREGKMRVRTDMRRVGNNPKWVAYPELVDSSKPKRREMASKEVYDVFRRFTRYVPILRPRDKQEPEHITMSRRRAHFYILTVYNFVCRPGEECLKLRFRDLTAQSSNVQDDAYWVVMRTTHGKKANRNSRLAGPEELVYHSDYNYFGYLNKWLEFLRSRDYPTGPEDYVFPVRKKDGYKPYNSTAAARYFRGIKARVKEWCESHRKGGLGERLEKEIDAFSMYSVRHIAIRNLIVESGYDFSKVAERAQTGVNMIQDFYYKYGLQPEKRGLISRHPTPSADNIKCYEDDDIQSVGGSIAVVQTRKGRKQ